MGRRQKPRKIQNWVCGHDLNKGSCVLEKRTAADCSALSTTEAKYMALTEVTKEVEWVRAFLKELQYGSDTPTTVQHQ